MRASTIGLRVLRRVTFAVLMIRIVTGCSVEAQIFSDRTFDDALWTSIVLPCSTPGSGVTATRDTQQGNPPSSRRTTHHYLPGNPGVLIAHIRKGASFNPSTQGAIASLDYSYDLRHYTGPERWAVAYSLLIVQNGSYYRGTWDNIFPDSWQSFSVVQLTASSFINICGSGPDHPDFSCNGSRIDFGYVTGNSNPNIGTPMQNRSSGIDNWRLTLRPVFPALVVDARPTTLICAGDSVTLMARGCVSYRWRPSAGLSCTDCDSPVASPPVTTTYLVEAIDAGGCSRLDSIRIEVTQLRAATRTGLALCRGEGGPLPSEAGASYRWRPLMGLDCDTCRNPIARPTESTVYTVTVGYGSSCITVDTVVVTVLPPPSTSVTGDVSICRGDSALLDASGGSTYQWTPMAGLTCADCSSPIAHPKVTTLYRVHIVDSNGCGADDSVLVKVNELPSVSVSDNVSICRGDSTLLSASGGSVYRWSPADGLTCVDCAAPIVHTDVTTLYRVHIVDSNGCSVDDSVLVEVNEPSAITVRIPRNLSARPGGIVRFPVLLEGWTAEGLIDRFDFGLTYFPDMLRVESLLLEGTLCQGWTIANLTHDRTTGRIIAQLIAPPGRWLTGPGVLMQIMATAYVGSADTSELEVTFIPPTVPCLMYRTVSGQMWLDSTCGLRYRLIERINGDYALEGNHPNPFNPTTTIAFSLGLDGPTTLDVFNIAGHHVATLVEAYLEAGRYEAVWDASSQPSGVYYYQIRSGVWSRRASMVLMK